MYITFISAKKANKAESSMALKPRADIARNPKHGYQWPQIGHVPNKDEIIRTGAGINLCTELLVQIAF